MAKEPVPRESRNLLQRSGLFKQVSCARHNGKMLLAAQFGKRLPIQLDDLTVILPDNQQSWRLDTRQGWPGKIRTASARNHCTDRGRSLGIPHQRGSPTVAGAELSNL